MSLFFIIAITVKESYNAQENLFNESLKNKALSIFNLIVDMRHWNASYDGVYLKTEELEPNPYLNPNFIKSNKDETLVWVNPAFMTRMISDIASRRDGFSLKITSNKLINKHNAPDADEKKILDQFEENPDIPYSWSIKDNTFKFMGALKTEKACLKCHAHQGYKVGDIRGGISVSFDITDEYNQLEELYGDYQQTLYYLIIAAIGAIITLLMHEMSQRRDERKISNLNITLQEKINELDEFNKTLHNKVKIEVEKQREKENLLIQQSKLAALGEMIGNIAHQWRQPISAVSAIIMNIKWTAISKGVPEDFINDKIKEANSQLNYMSQTIDDFRNFFKPDKEKEYFDVKVEVQKAYKIVEATLKNSEINLQIFTSSTYDVYGYPNEFSQVILNILSNAKDVIMEREIKEPKIEIDLYQKDKIVYCEISDNAGGIEKENMEKIFDPYFTTKESHGTGIGLYIAKEIIEKHMNGQLNIENSKLGAKFTISVPTVEDKNV